MPGEDNVAVLTLLIKADAELGKLSASKIEYEGLIKLIKDSGGNTKPLEDGLQKVNAQMGQRTVQVYSEGLQKSIAAQKAMGQSTAELEARLAALNEAQKVEKGDDQLAALAQRRAQLEQMISVTAAAGGETNVLEADLRGVNAQLAQRNFDLWIEGLQKQIVTTAALGQSTESLEAQLLDMQQARSFTRMGQDARTGAMGLEELSHESRSLGREIREISEVQVAYAQFLMGDFVGAARSAANALKGLTSAALTNPWLILIVAVAAAGAAVYEFYKGINEEAEKNLKEQEANSEKLQQAIAAAFERRYDPSNITRPLDEAAARADKVISKMHELRAATESLMDAELRRQLADIHLAEEKAVADAQNAGKSPVEIAAIRADYARQTARVESGGAYGKADAAVRDAKSDAGEAQDKVRDAALRYAGASQQLAQAKAEADAALKAVNQLIDTPEKQKLAEELADIDEKLNKRSYNPTTLPKALARRKELQEQLDIRDEQDTKNYEEAAKTAATKKAEFEKVKDQLEKAVLDAKAELDAAMAGADAARARLEAARVNAQAVGREGEAGEVKAGAAMTQANKAIEQDKIDKQLDETDRGLHNPALAPHIKPGESVQDFGKRQAAYNTLVHQAEQAIATAKKDGTTAPELTQVLTLLRQLLGVVDDLNKGPVTKQGREIEVMRRDLDKLNQTVKNNRVGQG